MIDVLRPLRVDGTIVGTPLIGEALGAATFVGPRTPWYDGPGPVPESVVREVMKSFGIGRWNMWFGLYGSSARVATDLDAVQRAFSTIEGVEITSTSYPGDVSPDDVDPRHRTRSGIPSMNAEHMTEWRERTPGTGAHTCFSPVVPLRGSEGMRAAEMVRSRSAEYGFDYLGVFLAGRRYMNHVVELLFDGSDAEQTRAVRDLFGVLIEDAAAEGYGEYRTHLAFMDLVAHQFDFNDHALLRVQETIKDALDPNGILAPGKSGIWPEPMRDRRSG